MRSVSKVWRIRPQDASGARRLAIELKISDVVARLLASRGLSDPQAAGRFLNPVLSNFHAPASLPGVGRAAELIVDAIQTGRRIRIYGDYDADGVTGTAILVRLVEQLGGTVDFHIPHRLDDGYGLNIEAVRKAKDDGVGLLVTVDCGITAVAEADEARRLGLPLVVTDHHEFQDQLPSADAIVHPRMPGGYPFAGLSGSGVAFKLAWVVAQRISGAERVTPELREHLLDAVGLAALGLVADVVPLQDENRIFVRHGLARIASRPSLGLKALIETCKLKDAKLTAEDVGYKLAPRLNAAGRLGCALLVVELLTTKSPVKAREIAECLDGFNAQRQTIERRMATEARAMLAEGPFADDPAIVLASPEWHQGVVGIVAGRITEQFGKPSVLIASRPNDEVSTGSGRSVPGVALHQVLKDCEDVLEGFGGHAAAAGVKVRPSRIADFRSAFAASIARRFPKGLPAPRLDLESEIPLVALTLPLIKELEKLEPYGADNPRPRFLAAGLEVVPDSARRLGTENRHLSFRVRQGSTTVKAIAFGMGERIDELLSAGGRCSLAFVPRVNEWQGRRSVEMEVVDLQAGSDPRIE
ncbi:MAG: single-stranded-DNA-specific exonuclease RecJ [Planctomycetia bacterium]|nr:single-stranded-DNA-specific exonuclease RecJ [Planctomycetia bacterium]